jgi:hypothetical protein
LSINNSTFPEASDESGNESDSYKEGEIRKNGNGHHKGTKRKEKMNYK